MEKNTQCLIEIKFPDDEYIDTYYFNSDGEFTDELSSDCIFSSNEIKKRINEAHEYLDTLVDDEPDIEYNGTIFTVKVLKDQESYKIVIPETKSNLIKVK